MNLFQRQKAFTLIEVMVVVVIIAVISGFSVLALSQAEGRRYVNQADNLLTWFQQLSEIAVLNGTAYGIVRDEQSLHGLVFFRNRWHRSAQPEPFQLFEGAELGLEESSATDFFDMFAESQENDRLPEIIMLPNGYLEPADEIKLSFLGQKETFIYQWDKATFSLGMKSQK